MSALPSIYSDEGLSQSERKKTITTGTPRVQRSIGAVKLETRVNHAVDIVEKSFDDDDGDIPMLGMDDEGEVQLVTDYILDKRSTQAMGFDSVLPSELLSSIDTKDLTPEERPSKETIMVVDTNFIISHLNIIDELAKYHVKYHHKIIIPTTAVKELDGLKSSKKRADDLIDGTTIGHLARWANDWIYRQLADSSTAVRGQKFREHIDRDATKDDAILDCCLYFQQKEHALVILLSNDKNLCMKALANDILTVSYRKGMSAELIATMSFFENKSAREIRHPSPQAVGAKPTPQYEYHYVLDDDDDDEKMVVEHDSFNDTQVQQQGPVQTATAPKSTTNNSHLVTFTDFFEAARQVHKETQILVLSSIDYCMYAEYEDDLELVGYNKANITSLKDSSLTLIRFWVSVFSDYFRTGFSKPFDMKGRKNTQYTEVPGSEEELQKFIKYWANVLRALYVKRDDTQNEALEKIIQRWEHIYESL